MPGQALPLWRGAESAPLDDMDFYCTLQYPRFIILSASSSQLCGSIDPLTVTIELRFVRPGPLNMMMGAWRGWRVRSIFRFWI
jgi:hypothetical protein